MSAKYVIKHIWWIHHANNFAYWYQSHMYNLWPQFNAIVMLISKDWCQNIIVMLELHFTICACQQCSCEHQFGTISSPLLWTKMYAGLFIQHPPILASSNSVQVFLGSSLHDPLFLPCLVHPNPSLHQYADAEPQHPLCELQHEASSVPRSQERIRCRKNPTKVSMVWSYYWSIFMRRESHVSHNPEMSI